MKKKKENKVNKVSLHFQKSLKASPCPLPVLYLLPVYFLLAVIYLNKIYWSTLSNPFCESVRN